LASSSAPAEGQDTEDARLVPIVESVGQVQPWGTLSGLTLGYEISPRWDMTWSKGTCSMARTSGRRVSSFGSQFGGGLDVDLTDQIFVGTHLIQLDARFTESVGGRHEYRGVEFRLAASWRFGGQR
jgi:hypothetical protein